MDAEEEAGEDAADESMANPDTGTSLEACDLLRFALNLESMVKRRLRRSWLTEVSGPEVVVKRTLAELTQDDEVVADEDEDLSDLVGDRLKDRWTGLLDLLPGLEPGVFFLGWYL